jgi:hypothetical protein
MTPAFSLSFTALHEVVDLELCAHPSIPSFPIVAWPKLARIQSQRYVRIGGLYHRERA